MQEGQIEISSTGFKFSYLRFLADGAAGLFLILLLTVGYYADLPILGQEKSFRDALGGHLGTEVKIFLMVLLGMLAVPIGLALNASGWFLLGWVQGRGCAFWFASKSFLTKGTRDTFQQDLLESAIQLSPHDIYRRAKLYEEFLMAVAPSHLVHVQHIMGLQRFVRSLSVIFASSGIYLLLSMAEPRWIFLAYVGAMLFSIALLSLLEYYVCLSIVCRAYLASLDCVEAVWSVDKRQGVWVPGHADAELLNRVIIRLDLARKASTSGLDQN